MPKPPLLSTLLRPLARAVVVVSFLAVSAAGKAPLAAPSSGVRPLPAPGETAQEGIPSPLRWGAGTLAALGFLYAARRKQVHRATARLTEKNRALLLEVGRHCLVEKELEESRRFLQGILDALAEPVLVIASDRTVVAMNRAARAFSGSGAAEGVYCHQLLHGLDHPCTGYAGRSFCGAEALSGCAGEATRTGEHELLLADGTRRWYEVTATVLAAHDGSRRFVLESLHDITRRKDAEESARLLADFDPLTGLPNRRLFNDRLTLALAQAYRHKEKVALLFLDLDRFKVINDTLGHAVGDLLLQEVARRLKGCCRREEDTIARQGGDEFIIILTEISDAAAAARIAQEIVESQQERFLVGGHELFISVSVGISVYPDDGKNAETLMKNADTALYYAKEHGKNSYKIFNPELNRRAMERLALENSIRRALKEEEFVLFYQPKVNVKSGRIVCLEALIRWHHPELGLLLPNEFMAVAEETGAMLPLGEWVLRSACDQNFSWQRAGHPPVRVAVNIAKRQFLKPDLVATVKRILEETGLEARWLDLELNFTMLLHAAEEGLQSLQQLAALGVHISVSNIGKGFTSVGFLRGLPVHTLKVDRSCVGEVQGNPEFAAAFVNMARTIDLEVIHEGVETVEQLAFFRSIACEELQGYLFCKPLPAEEVVQVLDKAVLANLVLGGGDGSGGALNNRPCG